MTKRLHLFCLALVACVTAPIGSAQMTNTVVGLGNAFVPTDIGPVVAIGTGSFHSLAILPDGTVRAWGDNSYGQATVPVGLSDVVQVGGGEHHSLALKSDGTVVAWGSNAYAQIAVPAGLADVVEVAAGAYHSLALKNDGTVIVWGHSGNQDLTPPDGLSGVVAIAAANGPSFALKGDGTVVAWGGFSPPDLSGLSDVVAIDAQYEHGIGLKSDGTVVVWGNSTSSPPRFGQLDVPAGLSDVVAVSAGGYHSLALQSDGTVVAWGGQDAYGYYTIPNDFPAVKAISAASYHGIMIAGAPSGDGPGDGGDLFRLQTEFRGPTECLEGNGMDSPYMNGAAFMDDCQDVSGQLWSMEDLGDGTVKFHTALGGAEMCLEGNGIGSPVQGGSAFMDVCQNVNGQAWTVVDDGDGYVLLKNRLGGEGMCLEGNNRHSSEQNGNAFMDECQGVTGQRWRIVPADDVELSGPGLSVASGAQVYWPTDTVDLSLEVSAASGLYAHSATLGFDTGRLSYETGSLAAGSLFTDGAPQVFEQVFPDAGSIEFATGRTDGVGTTADRGTTAAFTFMVADLAAPGDATFMLSEVDAVDADGSSFAFDAVDSSAITVGGVWPGDLDNDCSVGVLDLFPVAFHYNATGPARSADRDLTWGPKAFSPWGGSSAASTFPLSFVDGNGDGEIDTSDVLSLLVNFGQTRDPSTGCTPDVAGLAPVAAKSASPVVIPLGGRVGETVAFEISLPSAADALLGSAVRLEYGATGATVVALEPGSLLDGAMTVVKVEDGVAEAAFAYPGATAAVSGEGTLFRVVARIDAPDASVVLADIHLAAAGTGAVDEVDPSTGITVSEPFPTASEGGAETFAIAIGPNPARSSASVTLTMATASQATVTVHDALGRRVAEVRQTVASGTSRIELPVSSLAPGLYVVRITTDSGVATQTLTIAR